MARQFFSVLLLLSQMFFRARTQQCTGARSEESILGWMLQRHVYKTMFAELPHSCVLSCRKDDRCQSFNWVISISMCEFSNRTKDARPGDFISNPDRFYFQRDKNRVPLGSIPELPAETCTEIKASKGGKAISKKYWFSSIKPGVPVLAYCDMKTEDVDECTAFPSICDHNANCTNTRGSYRCTCKTGFSGDGKTCKGPWSFTTIGRKGRFSRIQTFTVPKTTRYLIEAWGARGGTHSCNYGNYPGTYYGGRGAYKNGTFSLNKGTVLNIVVGQKGGDSVEVQGGKPTNLTAAELGLSVEDNAGTGGGGGSFVYESDVLLLAAGGGGGSSAGYNGSDGQAGTSGTSSVGTHPSQIRSGGTGGQPGQCNNASASYHGGVGAGWVAQGCSRAGSSHGERGGSRAQGWVGGPAGKMNSGYNGGPPPGGVGGFGGGGGGSEDNGASGGGGGYSGGGSGTHSQQAGGGGGSYCSGSSCSGVTGGNSKDDGLVQIIELYV